MNIQQIQYILDHRSFPDTCHNPELIETHISWVIKAQNYVFKIKKPVNFGFLDFSSLNMRKYYCRREVLLNTRLTEDVYLSVIPVMNNQGTYYIGQGDGEIVDYAVMMKNLQADLHMPEMLSKHQVSTYHIRQIANVLANFHKQAKIVRKNYTEKMLGNAFHQLIPHINEFDTEEQHIITQSEQAMNALVEEKASLFQERVNLGWVRDVHGDLHTGNIFLYNPPVIFDCIEFNDDFREIDVLNDLAFLVMDLEYYGEFELAQTLLTQYTRHCPCFDTPGANTLFRYYKMYRANVRAKVNILQAIDPHAIDTEKYRRKAVQYVRLMKRYLDQVKQVADIYPL